MCVEVLAKSEREEVAGEHGRERDETPVLREVDCSETNKQDSNTEGRTRLTHPEPLDDHRRHDTEEAPIREPKQSGRHPEG